jgi:hypothetical protein
MPHMPQFKMSLFKSVQTLLQQPQPCILQVAGLQPPPELEELDALVVLEAVLLEELAPLDELELLDAVVELDELDAVVLELDAVVLLEELEELAPPVPLDELELDATAPPMPPLDVVMPVVLELELDVVVLAPPWPPAPVPVVVETPPPQPRIAAAPSAKKGVWFMTFSSSYRDVDLQVRTSFLSASMARSRDSIF